MNKAYRLIWSKAKERWIVAAETIKGNGGPSPITVAAVAVISAVLALTATGAYALPSGGQVAGGLAAINSPSATQMNITQGTNQAIINWNSFGIGRGEAVNISQPSASSTLLNRVLGNNPSEIFGSLTANGRVFLTNPSGILFAPGASVNVGGLVASSLNIKDSDFLAGNYSFFKDGTAGSVINQGNISGGFVALLGNSVENAGTIVTTKGSTGFAAGDEITLGFDPAGLMAIKVDKGAYNAQISNSGVIEADGGTVVMTAKAADALLGSVVNNSGVIRAQTMVERNGEIILEGRALIQTGTLTAHSIKADVTNLIDAGQWDASATSNGTVSGGSIAIHATNHIEQTASAVLNANGNATGVGGTIRIEAGSDAYLSGRGSASGALGGEIAITAPDLTLAGASLSVTGEQGGGRIRVGGGWQGGDADLANATRTRLNATTLDVSATQVGDGGTAVVWSENETLYASTISARGGEQGGNGGLVEISSHGTLGFGGMVDVKAPQGNNGRLLLDPKDIEIVAAASGGLSILSLPDPTPSANETFGQGTVVELLNNGAGIDRIVVAAPLDDTVATDAGAVHLYNSQTGALLATLTGSTASDQVGTGVTVLTNGNYVVRSSNWDNGAVVDAGAVTWGNGSTGISGAVSAANSLVGSTAGDQVGSGGILALNNGNYVVNSRFWDNGAVVNAGAVTWGNGITGISGEVSVANSLVGTTANDEVGVGGVTRLTNGNYVVNSRLWDNGAVVNAGAVTWGNGSTGISGVVSAANSLVGTTANDEVGVGGVTVLTNGNYVVASSFWDNNAGAVTWGNGSTGISGVVSAANSLVGSAYSLVGTGVTALTNGNYVVRSPNWGNGAVTRVGAATWGNGSTGTAGVISADNSLVGSTLNDQVGHYQVAALTNGNYVVLSVLWDNGDIADAGAATWGNGSSGTFGVVSAANSLVGSTAYDNVGNGNNVTVLTNGNYVVSSYLWDNGAVVNAGAVTWGNGSTGTFGVVSADKSLVGSTVNDQVGSQGGRALTNGNYVVSSYLWDNGAATDAGAVTWGNGSTGTFGAVSAANSLVGSTASDQVGGGNVPTVLTNGNYVVRSPNWDNGAVANVGAATWGNGSTGTFGVVSADNSLVGSTANDQLGFNGINGLANGNYVVLSRNWDNVGAATWGNGSTGTSGVVSAANSLVGSTAGDQVGIGGILALNNGNYVVRSNSWDSGAVVDAGAVTWCNGSTGTSGVVSAANSLVGSTAGDHIGGFSLSLSDGRVLVRSGNWDSLTPALVNAGRVDILSAGSGVTTLTNPHSFATNSAGTSTLLAADIKALLDAGTAVTLQANNDITLSTALTANNAGGTGGALTMQAGRSILLNASITTDSGALSLTANDSVAHGVIDADRDAGVAVITMATGTSIDAGSGAVNITLANSSDKTNNTAGDITLGGVTAASLNVTGAHSVMLMGSSNISGDISVEALGGNITVADNISGAAILAKASDNIVTAASTALKTNNGNLTLWSDSDNNGAGSISLGDSNTLNTSLNGASTSQATGGGKITLAGGLDTNADAIPDGYAISASSHGIGIGSNTSPAESTSNTTLYSGGGDVFIKGKTTATSGALFGLSYNGALTIDSGQGALSITGESAALYGIAFSLNKTSGQGLSLTSAKTSGTAISITGVTTATDSYGLTFNNDSTKDVLATGGGAIAINGTGTGSGYGIYLDGTRVLASADAITVDGGTAGINFAGGIANTIGKLTGTGVESSSSNIIVTGDRFTIGAATTVDTIGTLTVQSSGASFSSALTWPMTNLTASNITGLTLGKSGNTADITVGSATSIAGPISIYGGNIAIDAVLTASGSNTISLTGSGTITDGVSGYVVADKLALLGGNVTLDHASNAIGTLAASGVSGLTYVDSNALTIGTVNPTGISASGQVRIETLSGDLSITENIVTTNTSADALILNAGKSIAAGTATGGNILVTSGKSIEVGDGGTAKLYSGSVASSTGLSSFIGSGSGRFRYASDETTTNYSTALSTGNNAIYREQPTITTTATAASKAYDGVAYSGGNGVTLSGFFNDDTSVILGGTLAYGGTSQGAINADSYTITPSGYTNGLGYALAYTAGTLTIDKAHLTVTADDKSRLYGAANPVLTTSVSGFVNSEDVSVLTGSGSATTLANATTTVGTATITAGAGTLSAANYDFTTLTDGILNVTPAALSITADNASKVAGQTITFAGTEFTSNGLQNGETIGSVLLASLGADVSAVAAGSPYEITASDAGGGTFSAGNYTIAYNKGSLTVTPSPVNAPPVEQIPARIPPPPTTVPDVAPVTPPPLPVPSPALTPAVPDAVSSGRSFVSGGFVDARPLAVNAVEANAFVFPIPQNTFTHSDSKATILLTVRMVDGSPLPAWMSFDPVKKMISGIPPQGVSGEFDVIVIATDQFGGEARTRLKVRVGK